MIAGAAVPDAVRLGVAMTALQAGIGAVNDVRDAPADAAGKPAKPIPSGLVPRRPAVAVAVVAIAVGIGLSIPSGWWTVAIALAGLGVGLAYDLWLKGTAWSWLPFAIGIPLLPVYAWYGGTGSLPPAFALLVPAAVAAGAALAIGNARADAERDVASGVESIATALGPRRAWLTQVLILAAVGAVAVASAAIVEATITQLALVAGAALVTVVASVLSRDASASARERAWEIEAVGIAALGVLWLWVALAGQSTAGVRTALTMPARHSLSDTVRPGRSRPTTTAQAAAGSVVRTPRLRAKPIRRQSTQREAGTEVPASRSRVARWRRLVRLAAPDQSDRVLDLELRNGQVLREVGPIDLGDRLDDVGRSKDPNQVLERIGELVAGMDE